VAAGGLIAVAAYATETIIYKYDSRGRLIQVSHSGTVNNNVVTNYSYDKADNRNQVTTTGAP
jgi:YD repeat-containing protein